MGWEEVGDGVADGVGFGALGAFEGSGDDAGVAFFFDGEVEWALALGAGEDVHDLSSHLSSLGDYSIWERKGGRAALPEASHRHPNHPHLNLPPSRGKW